MIRAFYAAIAAMAAALVALACAASASALTVSPSGDYELMTGNFQWTTTSNGQALTCELNSLELSLDGSGAGEAPSGTGTWSGCSNSLLGVFRFTQVADWPVTVQLTATPLRVEAVVQIPGSGLQISVAGCIFWAEGTIGLDAGGTSLPAVANALSITTSSLRVSRNNGGFTCFAWPAGLAVTFTADYDLDRTMTVSG